LADFTPDRRFLHNFSEEKVPDCVNSAAHMTSRVGQYFDEAYRLIKDAGFTAMVTFNKRERKFTSI
jgi:histidinol-phosphatase (PHP family)